MAGQDAASQGVTATILAQVDALFAAPLPDDVVEWARHCVLDWLGVALAGAEDALTLALRDEAREEGGRPVASVLFHGDKTSPALAALVNASMADALDFSDANPNMHGHTTPAIVGAALALAEAKGASGRALLEAIVVGIEIGVPCRVCWRMAGFIPAVSTRPARRSSSARRPRRRISSGSMRGSVRMRWGSRRRKARGWSRRPARWLSPSIPARQR